jgi:uncharacterized protein
VKFASVLGDTLIGIRLEPHEGSVRKRQSQKPKFYLFDLGVKNAIQGTLRQRAAIGSGDFGRAFEAWIVVEVQRLNAALELGYRFSYLRTKDDAEIDLIVERGRDAPILIEIKAKEFPTDRDARHLDKLGADMRHAERWIVSLAPRAKKLEGGSFVLPWRDAFTRLFG